MKAIFEVVQLMQVFVKIFAIRKSHDQFQLSTRNVVLARQRIYA